MESNAFMSLVLYKDFRVRHTLKPDKQSTCVSSLTDHRLPQVGYLPISSQLKEMVKEEHVSSVADKGTSGTGHF